MKRLTLILSLFTIAPIVTARAQDPATNAPAALVMRHHGVLPLITECALLLSQKPLLVPSSNDDCGEWGVHADTEPFDFDEWIKSYAGVRGVAWPEGSSAHYVPAFGRIEVLNTEENQARFAEVVRPFGAYQIRVRTRHASVAPAAFEELGLDEVVGGTFPPDEWAALRKRLAAHPGVEMRACQSVLARPGTTVTGKGVVECIYPTELAVEAVDDGTNTVGGILPCEFQTREVGNILAVTPSLTPDGTRIVLDIVPTVVFPPEWRDYPATSLAPGTVTALPAPFFPVFSLALSIDVKRGNTVALGGALLAEPGKGERFQLFFVNADVVDLDGVTIPAP